MTAIAGKSFIARLACVTPAFEGPITFSTGHQIAKSGWLLRGNRAQQGVPLRFDYISEGNDRILYHVSGAPGAGDYAGARLGVSTNGYLGFYHVSSVTGAWKIELLSDGSLEEGGHFLLRDQHGQRVAVNTRMEPWGNLANPHPSNMRRFDYLSVWEGEIVEFQLTVEQVL